MAHPRSTIEGNKNVLLKFRNKKGVFCYESSYERIGSNRVIFCCQFSIGPGHGRDGWRGMSFRRRVGKDADGSVHSARTRRRVDQSTRGEGDAAA